MTDEKDAALIAGAAGTALCLGADFVKVNPPSATDEATSAELYATLRGSALANGWATPEELPDTIPAA